MIIGYIGLSDLLENDPSSYEFFNTLPTNIQSELNRHDIGSFEELQRKAANILEKDQKKTQI